MVALLLLAGFGVLLLLIEAWLVLVCELLFVLSVSLFFLLSNNKLGYGIYELLMRELVGQILPCFSPCSSQLQAAP